MNFDNLDILAARIIMEAEEENKQNDEAYQIALRSADIEIKMYEEVEEDYNKFIKLYNEAKNKADSEIIKNASDYIFNLIELGNEIYSSINYRAKVRPNEMNILPEDIKNKIIELRNKYNEKFAYNVNNMVREISSKINNAILEEFKKIDNDYKTFLDLHNNLLKLDNNQLQEKGQEIVDKMEKIANAIIEKINNIDKNLFKGTYLKGYYIYSKIKPYIDKYIEQDITAKIKEILEDAKEKVKKAKSKSDVAEEKPKNDKEKEELKEKSKEKEELNEEEKTKKDKEQSKEEPKLNEIKADNNKKEFLDANNKLNRALANKYIERDPRKIIVKISQKIDKDMQPLKEIEVTITHYPGDIKDGDVYEIQAEGPIFTKDTANLNSIKKETLIKLIEQHNITITKNDLESKARMVAMLIGIVMAIVGSFIAITFVLNKFYETARHTVTPTAKQVQPQNIKQPINNTVNKPTPQPVQKVTPTTKPNTPQAAQSNVQKTTTAIQNKQQVAHNVTHATNNTAHTASNFHISALGNTNVLIGIIAIISVAVVGYLINKKMSVVKGLANKKQTTEEHLQLQLKSSNYILEQINILDRKLLKMNIALEAEPAAVNAAQNVASFKSNVPPEQLVKLVHDNVQALNHGTFKIINNPEKFFGTNHEAVMNNMAATFVIGYAILKLAYVVLRLSNVVSLAGFVSGLLASGLFAYSILVVAYAAVNNIKTISLNTFGTVAHLIKNSIIHLIHTNAAIGVLIGLAGAATIFTLIYSLFQKAQQAQYRQMPKANESMLKEAVAKL